MARPHNWTLDALDDLFAEIEALTQELKRMEGFGPEPILYERVREDCDRLASQLRERDATLRRIATHMKPPAIAPVSGHALVDYWFKRAETMAAEAKAALASTNPKEVS